MNLAVQMGDKEKSRWAKQKRKQKRRERIGSATVMRGSFSLIK